MKLSKYSVTMDTIESLFMIYFMLLSSIIVNVIVITIYAAYYYCYTCRWRIDNSPTNSTQRTSHSTIQSMSIGQHV